MYRFKEISSLPWVVAEILGVIFWDLLLDGRWGEFRRAPENIWIGSHIIIGGMLEHRFKIFYRDFGSFADWEW